MRRKRYLWLIVLLVVVLAVSIPLAVRREATFNGSSFGDRRSFHLSFSVMNTTESHDLAPNAGETLSAALVSDGGTLAVTIQKGDDAPLFEGTDLTTQNFTVTAQETGTYTVSVTGRHAKGSFDITVQADDGNQVI